MLLVELYRGKVFQRESPSSAKTSSHWDSAVWTRDSESDSNFDTYDQSSALHFHLLLLQLHRIRKHTQAFFSKTVHVLFSSFCLKKGKSPALVDPIFHSSPTAVWRSGFREKLGAGDDARRAGARHTDTSPAAKYAALSRGCRLIRVLRLHLYAAAACGRSFRIVIGRCLIKCSPCSVL